MHKQLFEVHQMWGAWSSAMHPPQFWYQVYQYEHPNSGTQKNKKAVKILFIISSSSDWLFYFWHQDVTIYVTILRSLNTKSELRRRIKKTMKPSMWLQINITTCIIHYIWCLKKSYTALLFLLKLNADPLVHGT